MTTYENLRAARRGPIVSIAAYLLLTIAKLLAGHFLNSSSLIADGFNNLSDILGNVALLIGSVSYTHLDVYKRQLQRLRYFQKRDSYGI